MSLLEHDPDGIRMSAEDCDKAGMPAAAQTLRDLANEVEASRPQLRGAVDALRAAQAYLERGSRISEDADVRAKVDAALANLGGQ